MVVTKVEYNQTVEGTSAHYKKVNEVYHLNNIAFEDLILLLDHKHKTRRSHSGLSILQDQ